MLLQVTMTELLYPGLGMTKADCDSCFFFSTTLPFCFYLVTGFALSYLSRDIAAFSPACVTSNARLESILESHLQVFLQACLPSLLWYTYIVSSRVI